MAVEFHSINNLQRADVKSTFHWKETFNVQTLRGLVAKYPDHVQKILEDSSRRLSYHLTDNEVDQLRSIKSQHDMDFKIASALYVSDNIGKKALGIASKQIQDYTRSNPIALNQPEMVPSSIYQNVIRSVELLKTPHLTSSQQTQMVNNNDVDHHTSSSISSLVSGNVSKTLDSENDMVSVDFNSIKTVGVSDIRNDQIQLIDTSGDCLFHSVHHQLRRLGKLSIPFKRSANTLTVCSQNQINNDKTDILNFIFEDPANYEFYSSLFPSPNEATLKANVEQYFKNQNYWRGETETNSLTEHSFLYYAQQFQTNIAVISEDRTCALVYKPDGIIDYHSEAVQSDWVTIIRTLGGSHFESVIIDD